MEKSYQEFLMETKVIYVIKSIDWLNESSIHSRQSDHTEFNSRFRLLSPFAPNFSIEEEYDPSRSIGQKGWKLRTAGNSPAATPCMQITYHMYNIV